MAFAQQGGESSMPAKQAPEAHRLDASKLKLETETVVGVTRGDRVIPVPPGGTCQQSGLAAHSNATAFNCLDNFHPTANGTITTVNWAGVYRQGLATTASPLANAAPPTGTETFQINFYNNNNTTRLPSGTPNGLATAGTPAASFNVNATRTTDTVTLTVGGVVYTLYNYTATLSGGFAVTNTNCYWIEIRNTTPGFDIPFTSTGYMWRWARNTGGDVTAIQKDINTSPSAVIGPEAIAGDFAFCLNVPFDRATPCAAYPSCTQVAANCQNYGTGTDNLTSSSTGGFVVADNFRVNAATNLTGLCFTGFYAGQILPPADESFTVNIYSSNTVVATGQTAPFNFPTTLVASTSLNNGGGVGTQPYTIRAARFNTGGGTGFLNFLEWTATFTTPIALAPGCYWIEIFNNSATGWAWLSNTSLPQATTTVNGGDGFSVQRAFTGTYDASSQARTADRAFCLSFAINPIGTACPPGPAALNATCNNAITLPTDGSSQFGFVLANGGGANLPPNFGGLIDNTNEGGVWYRVVGTGGNVTISTCNTAATSPGGGVPQSTNYDTYVSVYCADTCAGPFKAVAFNDEQAAAACTLNAGAAPIGASSVTFPSVLNQNYYVFVAGAGGATGFHWISAATAALGTTTASPCADIQEPPCVLGAPGTGFTEPEACGDTVAGAGDSCQTPYTLAYGTTAFGTTYTTGTARDRDFYKLPDVTATTSLDISLKCEAPVNVFVVTNGAATCPATGDPVFTTAVGFTIFPSCRPATFQFQANAAAGNVFVLVLPTAFDGLPCSANRNKYELTVSPSATGACCVVAGTGCVISTRDNCADPNGDNGQYIGDGTVCSPADCDPNTGTAVAAVGACCTFDGGCSITVQTGCGTGNSWLGANTACTATGCPTVQACCFSNGYCTVLTSSACGTQGGNVLAGRFCLPNTCPTAPPVGSCCNNATGACTTGVTQAACTTGAWTLAGTCVPNTCPQPTGACCNSVDGTCTVQTGAAACTGLGATFSYQGNGTSCTPNICPQPTNGRCCVGARCAVAANAAACTALEGGGAGSVFTAGTSTCNATGNFITPCCYANYNKVGGITVQDIFDFLSGWFANSPNANVEGTGGIPTVQDIFDFLAAWFAGGCS